MSDLPSFAGEPIKVGAGQVFINPGTGPVEDADGSEARKNVEAFVKELACGIVRIRRIRRQDYGDGRYAFRLYHGGRTCDIQMPGLPLAQVRFTGEASQNAWHYPRLYVEGSSWLWMFALNCARAELTGKDD